MPPINLESSNFQFKTAKNIAVLACEKKLKSPLDTYPAPG